MSLGSTVEAPATTEWWRSAVVYQVYIRSFADGNGDGIGDIAGMRARLPHLAASASTRCGSTRGTRRRWPTPATTCPTTATIDPAFGTLGRGRGVDRARRTRRACACCWTSCPTTPPTSTPGSRPRWRGAAAARAGAVPVPARPRADGAAQRLAERASAGRPGPGSPDGCRGTCTCSPPSQPDLDWTNPEVRRRVRVGAALLVRPGRRRVPHRRRARPGEGRGPARRRLRRAPTRVLEPDHRADHPFWDRDGVHEIYRGWRQVADSYPAGKVFVAEAWVRSTSASPATCAPTSCTRRSTSTSCNAPWDASGLRAVIDESLSTYGDGRRARHLGAVQPRRRAARHAAGPPHARAARSLPRCRRSRRSTASWARGGPARPRC